MHSLHWILVLAGILALYFGFWYIFMKLISYLSERIENKIVLYTISGGLWFIVVYVLTGTNLPMTCAITVTQAAVALPYTYLKLRQKP